MYPVNVSSTGVSEVRSTYSIALIGNPNSGKSSLFNQLTGLQQRVGNFPGVTVERKEGKMKLPGGQEVKVIDFPGTYSLYPTSYDERIVVSSFCNPQNPDYPDAILYIADVTQLEKHLLLLTQLRDCSIPVILLLNMTDLAREKGMEVQEKQLAKFLGVPVLSLSARTGEGLGDLYRFLPDFLENPKQFNGSNDRFFPLSREEEEVADSIRKVFPQLNEYQAVLAAHHYQWLAGPDESQRKQLENIVEEKGFVSLKMQVREIMGRYDRFTPVLRRVIRRSTDQNGTFTEKLDRLLTHRLWGQLIFFMLMLLVFQAIYAWAGYPMDAIDWTFNTLGGWVQDVLPAGWVADLLTDGILAGLGGIMVFIPQIAILFFLITLLEEVGYMARAVYLFDNLMQKFGLNGRSIVALISGGACAIPAIMSTRTIGNWKERLITIMVTPLISCSARIPVYTVLIGFVVPSKTIWGVLNMQGLAFMGLYMLSIGSALVTAYILKKILKTKESSFLLLELPAYRRPLMRNVWITVYEKVKSFTFEAGRIILVISVILWALASYGPPKAMEAARTEALQMAETYEMDEMETKDLIASKKIESSYAGHLGKLIEPAIQPLGYDWKIGIALITSFAAREVFVSTMATIYSIGSEQDEYSIRTRLAKEKNPVTGEKVYNFATSLSLLIFYVFAMQCMSTLAVVRRETNSWKWPMWQFVYMTGLAYLGALFVYQIFG